MSAGMPVNPAESFKAMEIRFFSVARPHSILGTLAEVGLLRRSGLDVQVIGFGDGLLASVGRLKTGVEVLARVLGLLGRL